MRPNAIRTSFLTSIAITSIALVSIEACRAGGAASAAAPCTVEARGSPVLHGVILVDRTFDPDESTRDWLARAVEALVSVDGVVIQVGSFAAAGGRDGAVLKAPVRRPSPPAESQLRELRRSQVARLQACYRAQIEQLQDDVTQALQSAMSSQVRTASNTDIGASFLTLKPAFDATGATQKLLVLVSDGLEYERDGVQDFYRNGVPRRIDPIVERKRLEQRGIVGDLTGIRVVWVGLGTAQAQISGSTYQTLQQYWREVITAHGGEPIELATTPRLTPGQILRWSKPPSQRLAHASEANEE